MHRASVVVLVLLGIIFTVAACGPAPTPTPAYTPTPSVTPTPTETPTPSPTPTPTTIPAIAVPFTGDARADAKAYLAKACPEKLGGELRMLVWEGYADPSFAQLFQEICGVRLIPTFVGSGDELIAKMQDKSNTFDLISPSSDAASFLVENNLVQPLALNLLPTRPKLAAPLRAWSGIEREARIFGVPIAFAPNVLIYDPRVFEKPPDSWNALWDPNLSGKIALPDDVATVWMIAQSLGLDKADDRAHLFDLSDDELTRVKEKYARVKPNIRVLWQRSGELVQMLREHEIVAALGYPLHVAALRQQNVAVEAVIPKEGTTGWADYWMIPQNAANVRAAYVWIEFASQPFAQKLIADKVAQSIANSQAASYFTPEQVRELHLDALDRYAAQINFAWWSTRRDAWAQIKTAPNQP